MRTNRLVLAEYVADFLELTPETGVEVVAQSDTGKTLVRTVDLAKASSPFWQPLQLAAAIFALVYPFRSS